MVVDGSFPKKNETLIVSFGRVFAEKQPIPFSKKFCFLGCTSGIFVKKMKIGKNNAPCARPFATAEDPKNFFLNSDLFSFGSRTK